VNRGDIMSCNAKPAPAPHAPRASPSKESSPPGNATLVPFPPSTTIGAQAWSYCRVLRGGGFLWARYPCTADTKSCVLQDDRQEGEGELAALNLAGLLKDKDFQVCLGRALA